MRPCLQKNQEGRRKNRDGKGEDDKEEEAVLPVVIINNATFIAAV